jgi:hypothetical protein
MNLQEICAKYRISDNYLNSKDDAYGIAATSIDDLIGDLNDFISHELTHKKQYERGDKIPKRNIKRPETYYSQPHELEAQLAGFKRKSKLSKVPLEVVIRNYFDKRRDKYNLTDRIIDRLTKRIMDYGS